ncbi:MAG: hypothetical protein KKE77_06285 [Alphaproteobacteria bacterium]|nr:hypothetical protein [Alphaproteobacteria bacterium]
MSKHFTRELVAEQATIRAEPRQQLVVDRSFEMPKALYAATVALYLGFIGVLGLGLQSPGLAIPMAIFAIFIVAGFGVPMIWTKLAPQPGQRPLDLQQLMRRGIATHTGRLAGRDAVVQMMILPVLILVWGITVVAIVALT